MTMTMGERLAADPMPDTSTQPPKAMAAHSSFRRVIFSRKQTADISMTQIGDVYSRIAATDRDARLMVVK